jgi:FlaA1/EpsC-like NDP-sugar epimerase
LAVVLGYAIAAGLHLLVMQDRNELVLLAVHYLLLAGMAAPAVVMTRAALRLVQDLLHWRMRSSGMAGVTVPRTLVVGAGYRTTLFLRQISFRMPEYQALRVVGLVSDDTAMIGHMVHGLRVLGQIRELPALVAQHRIDVVYLVEPVTAEEEASIRRMLQPTSVRLIRWDIVETELLRDA